MSTTPTMARKERERAAREELILEQARRMLAESGYLDLNLDELARRVEYSKGTLYQHFSSKEDLVMAIAVRGLQARAGLFERALGFRGANTRECVQAISVAAGQFCHAFPDYFEVETLVKLSSFALRASELRRNQLGLAVGRGFRCVQGIVQAALHLGDLPAHAHLAPERIAFALASVSVGSEIMGRLPELRLLAGIDNLAAVVRENQSLLLDGCGWKPLRSEYDMAAVDRRIRAEVFPEASWLDV
ncbi:TetR/AcrR family transcriptional regulator [Plasticicumulans acidivorans]|uniref:TetR family transcriptional regulator n=1 Tax=Plasticicumulans acidivorans TaxID=886464 RepID=A0A317MVM7_9GAMM|nr:TetR/AcrR family transcriptional regulator [Plasticicumulans acidivorans]PWV61181.1 TetR family transcriptional regulator [Plasticicumulans acidivorans]